MTLQTTGTIETRSKAKFFNTIKSTKFINSERVSENGGQYGLYCETRKNNVQQTGGGCLFVVTMNVYEQFAQVPNTQLFIRTFRLETRPREKQNFHTRLKDQFITIGIYYIIYIGAVTFIINDISFQLCLQFCIYLGNSYWCIEHCRTYFVPLRRNSATIGIEQ